MLAEWLVYFNVTRTLDDGFPSIEFDIHQTSESLSDARGRTRLGSAEGARNGNYCHGFYTADATADRSKLRVLIRKLSG